MIKKMMKKFEGIDTEKDLKKNKLSLSDYDLVFRSLSDLYYNKSTKTYIKAVADWFKRNGANVKMDEEGINYIITIK